MPKEKELLHRRLHLLGGLISLGFTAVTLALIFWGVLRANALLARSDNPRPVEAELRIQRGLIFDRHGVVLAENTGTPARQRRYYPIPTVGPAVGYYSFRFGTSGVEESYDAILRGAGIDFWVDAWRRLLHEPQRGQAIQLTLDAAWQQEASRLMANQTGALLLLELEKETSTAAIRALVSLPGYNPNLLDQEFDTLRTDTRAPLLNRVTQGQYQPGLTLQPFLLATVLDRGFIQLNEIVAGPNRHVLLNGSLHRCFDQPPEPASWLDVLVHRCPAPMQDLGNLLGTAELDSIFANWGMTEQPNLPLNTQTPAQEPLSDVALAAIGQDKLTVTPLQMGLALATLANDGRFPALQLVEAIQQGENWLPVTVLPDDSIAISANAAEDIRLALPRQNGVAEHAVLVLSGPDNSKNGWYLALAPATNPRYLLVVVIENAASLETAVEIGQELLAGLASRD